jgi:hypothetical protein
MGWKRRYEEKIITDIRQLKVGDLVSYSYNETPNDREIYCIIKRIEDGKIWGVWHDTKELALTPTHTRETYMNIDTKRYIIRKERVP